MVVGNEDGEKQQEGALWVVYRSGSGLLQTSFIFKNLQDSHRGTTRKKPWSKAQRTPKIDRPGKRGRGTRTGVYSVIREFFRREMIRGLDCGKADESERYRLWTRKSLETLEKKGKGRNRKSTSSELSGMCGKWTIRSTSSWRRRSS